MYSLYFDNFETSNNYYEKNNLNNENGNNLVNMVNTVCFMLFLSYFWYEYFYSTKIELNYVKEEEEELDKDEIKDNFDNYIEMVKIRRFFSDFANQEKLVNIFNNESMIISIHKLITEYEDDIFIHSEKYINYYKKSEVKTNYISLNIKELYDEEQRIYIEPELFDIKNNKGYYRINDCINKKEIYTNLARLNVYKWIIELGIYDMLYESLC
jgi:hypothetical protein